jgi:hypothetical protein
MTIVLSPGEIISFFIGAATVAWLAGAVFVIRKPFFAPVMIAPTIFFVVIMFALLPVVAAP